jgi:hypothetical protein
MANTTSLDSPTIDCGCNSLNEPLVRGAKGALTSKHSTALTHIQDLQPGPYNKHSAPAHIRRANPQGPKPNQAQPKATPRHRWLDAHPMAAVLPPKQLTTTAQSLLASCTQQPCVQRRLSPFLSRTHASSQPSRSNPSKCAITMIAPIGVYRRRLVLLCTHSSNPKPTASTPSERTQQLAPHFNKSTTVAFSHSH